MNRRLGNRFQSGGTQSVLAGTLTIGQEQQQATIIRRQTGGGESVEIMMAGRRFSWDQAEGVKAVQDTATEAELLLVERLVLDSPDQFVLAQLRGASYHLVGRKVRADVGGDENYTGPLWDLTRVEEPETDSARRPLSNSRLYYVNVQTGLIDKIVSEFKGETIEANILQWLDQAGEKYPSQIVWRRNNETVQEFRLTTVSTTSAVTE